MIKMFTMNEAGLLFCIGVALGLGIGSIAWAVLT